MTSFKKKISFLCLFLFLLSFFWPSFKLHLFLFSYLFILNLSYLFLVSFKILSFLLSFVYFFICFPFFFYSLLLFWNMFSLVLNPYDAIWYAVICFKLGKCLDVWKWRWRSNSLNCVSEFAVKKWPIKYDYVHLSRNFISIVYSCLKVFSSRWKLRPI